jgi:hypothetical protein
MTRQDLAAAYRDTRGLVEYHEAAHTLVAHRLRLPIRRVEIGRVCDSGYTQLARSVYDPHKRLCVLVAGRIGERLAPAWDDRLDGLSAGDDERGIADTLAELGRTSAADAETRVDLILLDHRRALRRLAKALIDRRSLDGAEVAAIVAE